MGGRSLLRYTVYLEACWLENFWSVGHLKSNTNIQPHARKILKDLFSAQAAKIQTFSDQTTDENFINEMMKLVIEYVSKKRGRRVGLLRQRL